MTMTAAQLVTNACAIAKCPGFTLQAGQLLNMILADLAETYDFDIAKATTTITLGSTSGPYPLPTDYLRSVQNDVFYTIDGVKYTPVPVSMAEYDSLVQTAGLQSYPYVYTVDFENQDVVGYPELYVWPPPSGSYPLTVRYLSQPADITTPEGSSSIPWFPNQTYLVTRLAGELMKITDDERWSSFLGDGPEGAQGILNRYLKSKEEAQNLPKNVNLDRRLFGLQWGRLKNTKTIGW